jgi:2,6-dihydroxypyridine 3-monooxygenase
MRAVSLRVAVSGGSIGGLTAALVLRDAGHEVDVYERSPSRLEGRGAGIVLHEATLRYLVERQGTPVEQLSEGASRLRYLTPTGALQFEEPSSERFTSWNALHGSLLDNFDAERYHLGERVAGFTQDDDGVEVVFDSGATVDCDLLVCAEGISSSTRELLLPEVQPTYSGYVGWRGTVDAALLSEASRTVLDDTITYAVPPYNQALIYPIPQGHGDGRKKSLLNWLWYRNVEEGAALDELMTDRSGQLRRLSLGAGTVREEVLDELRAEAKGTLPPPLAEAIEITVEPFVQVIVDVEVPRMAFGRVCVLGDAAFAARPHAAAGTAKAAEDGWALAAALTAAGDDVPAALRAWEPGQLELGRFVVGRSRAMGERSQVSCTWDPEDRTLRFGLRGAGR